MKTFLWCLLTLVALVNIGQTFWAVGKVTGFLWWKKKPKVVAIPREEPPAQPKEKEAQVYQFPTVAEMRAKSAELSARPMCHNLKCPAFGKHNCHDGDCREHHGPGPGGRAA